MLIRYTEAVREQATGIEPLTDGGVTGTRLRASYRRSAGSGHAAPRPPPSSRLWWRALQELRPGAGLARHLLPGT